MSKKHAKRAFYDIIPINEFACLQGQIHNGTMRKINYRQGEILWQL